MKWQARNTKPMSTEDVMWHARTCWMNLDVALAAIIEELAPEQAERVMRRLGFERVTEGGE